MIKEESTHPHSLPSLPLSISVIKVPSLLNDDFLLAAFFGRQYPNTIYSLAGRTLHRLVYFIRHFIHAGDRHEAYFGRHVIVMMISHWPHSTYLRIWLWWMLWFTNTCKIERCCDFYTSSTLYIQNKSFYMYTKWIWDPFLYTVKVIIILCINIQSIHVLIKEKE